MRPLTVMTGFVLGSSASIATSLALVLIVFAILGDDYPRVQLEFRPLTVSMLIFTALTAIAAASFYTLLRNRRGRWPLQVLMWVAVGLTGLWFWP